MEKNVLFHTTPEVTTCTASRLYHQKAPPRLRGLIAGFSLQQSVLNPVAGHAAFMHKLALGRVFSSSTTVSPVIYHFTSVTYIFIKRGWCNEPICVRGILELVSLYFYVKQ
jgi:hypothetical protein